MHNPIKLFLFFSMVCFGLSTSYAQNIGVGTVSPSEKLEVVGNIKADTIKSSGLQLSTAAGEGKVLTSDGLGNANWVSPTLQLKDIVFKTGAVGSGPVQLGGWYMFNNYATVSVEAGQTVVVYCQAGLGRTSAANSTFRLDVVYQDDGGGTVMNMAGSGAIILKPSFASIERKQFSVFGQKTFSAAGTYRIGLGILTSTANYLNYNDFQNVMIMIYD